MGTASWAQPQLDLSPVPLSCPVSAIHHIRFGAEKPARDRGRDGEWSAARSTGSEADALPAIEDTHEEMVVDIRDCSWLYCPGRCSS